MNSIRSALFALKNPGFEIDPMISPLLQPVDRSKNARKKMFSRASSRGTHPFLATDASRTSQSSCLGKAVADWKRYGFELSNSSCELRFYLDDDKQRPNPEFSPRTVTVGFIRSDTTVIPGSIIESDDIDVLTMDRLRLHTLEICFLSDEFIYPRYCVLGHADHQERDHWIQAIHSIIDAKSHLFGGWDHFVAQNHVTLIQKAEVWAKMRSGEVGVHVNAKATRCARLKNGKVMNDVPYIFERFAEPPFPEFEDEPQKRVLDHSRVLPALSELGLNLNHKLSERLLDELRRTPGSYNIPGKINLEKFRMVVEACRREILVPPSDEMKRSLLRIMKDSKNPFLSLLSRDEQLYLIEGRDTLGHNVCICKTYTKDAVLVRQNDDGDSMFLILEGSLSVVVTFGSGSSTLQKEVAVLSAGAVMGEMSLVLGKPRSATCVVKSDTASVAEITNSAIAALMETRPSLARELEEMVYRRDASNVVVADRTAAAGHKGGAAHAVQFMMQYHQRGAEPVAPAAKMPAIGRAQSADPACEARARRIQSRTGRAVRRYPAVSDAGVSAFPVARGARGGLSPSPGGRGVKSGRWVKCRGVHVFLVD